MYHTNVVMAVGTDVAVVCLESVADPAERKRLKGSLSTHHEVSITLEKLPGGSCRRLSLRQKAQKKARLCL